jgi:putative copper export protein/mono/diheme cytochrome c family protein
MSALDMSAALLRGVHVGALVSLFGTLLFAAVVLPADSEAASVRRALVRLEITSALVALIAGIAWLVTETAAIADADSVAMTLHAVPTVALRTQFGHWLLLRMVLLVVLMPLLRYAGYAIPIAVAGAALGLQPMLGHAGAIGGGTGAELIASEVLHLLAAGAWLGGLLPLFTAVRRLPHAAAASACRGFTPVGLASILLLGGTAVVQVATLMGGLPGLLGTPYGHVALVKLGLFVVLLVLAALNRLVLTERLAAISGARRQMQLSIGAEIILGTLIVITAGFLASRTPGTHEQPVWPLPWRPSAWAFADPALRYQAIIGLIMAAAGVGAVMAGLTWRRMRWIALSASAIVIAAAIPYLGLLFVPAYPTSFFTSPTEFAATAITHGARLFVTDCVACHGIEGHGDGPNAKSLPLPPADLTAAHFLAHSDGELYWFISHGFTTPDGATAMPGFARTLSSEAIWDLIDYLRAHNAGYAFHQTGRWPQPLPMPQFDAQCVNGRTIDLDDLRGRPLRIIAAAGDEPDPPLPGDVDATTILVMRSTTTKPTDTACIASEPQVRTALAIIVGLSPDTLDGTQVLVDPNMWLRAAWHPGDADDWNDPHVLTQRLRDIVAHPLVVDSSSAHVHRH